MRVRVFGPEGDPLISCTHASAPFADPAAALLANVLAPRRRCVQVQHVLPTVLLSPRRPGSQKATFFDGTVTSPVRVAGLGTRTDFGTRRAAARTPGPGQPATAGPQATTGPAAAPTSASPASGQETHAPAPDAALPDEESIAAETPREEAIQSELEAGVEAHHLKDGRLGLDAMQDVSNPSRMEAPGEGAGSDVLGSAGGLLGRAGGAIWGKFSQWHSGSSTEAGEAAGAADTTAVGGIAKLRRGRSGILFAADGGAGMPGNADKDLDEEAQSCLETVDEDHAAEKKKLRELLEGPSEDTVVAGGSGGKQATSGGKQRLAAAASKATSPTDARATQEGEEVAMPRSEEELERAFSARRAQCLAKKGEVRMEKAVAAEEVDLKAEEPTRAAEMEGNAADAQAALNDRTAESMEERKEEAAEVEAEREAALDKKPVRPSDIWDFVVHHQMERARRAAVVADAALIEAQKQQVAARHYKEQALMFEARAMRGLRDLDLTRKQAVQVAPGTMPYPLTPDQTLLYLPPDGSLGAPRMPPGWELPPTPMVKLGTEPEAFRVNFAGVVPDVAAVLPLALATGGDDAVVEDFIPKDGCGSALHQVQSPFLAPPFGVPDRLQRRLVGRHGI